MYKINDKMVIGDWKQEKIWKSR